MIIYKYENDYSLAFGKLPPNKEGFGSYSILGYKLHGDVNGLRRGGWSLNYVNANKNGLNVEHLTPNFMDTWEKVT